MTSRSFKSNRYYESLQPTTSITFVPCWQCCVFGASDSAVNPYYRCALENGVAVLGVWRGPTSAQLNCCYPGTCINPTSYLVATTISTTGGLYSCTSCYFCGCWTPTAYMSCSGWSGSFIRVG